MNSHHTCPICSNNEVTLLRHYEAKELFKCKACRMVFDRRIPDMITLHNHYEQYGRNDYLSPITRKRYRELLDSMHLHQGEKKILDIGAGIGFFLETAKGAGWEVYGTEFTDEAIRICEEKGIKMFKGSLEDIDFGDLKFDVVTSFELIEHLSEPMKHFKVVQHVLKKGGLYYLTTPNFNSLNSRLLKEKWNVISFPEHLMYFTRHSLTEGLTEAGFTVIGNQSTGISPGRFIKSQRSQNMDFSDTSSTDELLRENLEKNSVLRFMKKSMNALLSKTGFGESLKVWAIKS